MNIHEYQAKSLLKKYGVTVPRGGVAFSVDEAVSVAKALALDLKEPVWVVKSQIHAGGRGKGGGVKVVKSVDGVEAEAKRMLGMQLVTHQTGPKGQKVGRLYVEEGCDIKRELYLGLLIDRATSKVTIMASTEGGMEIEEVAAHSPEKIMKVAIDPVTGLQALPCPRDRVWPRPERQAGQQMRQFPAWRCIMPSSIWTAQLSKSIRWSSPVQRRHHCARR